MIEAKFSNEMLQYLGKLNNSWFIKYITDDETGGNSTYCKLGIDSDNVCLDIFNEETNVDWFVSGNKIQQEDISVFSCAIRNDGEKFQPYLGESQIIAIDVNEKIGKVEIVSDLIDVNNGEYTIDYDMAIIIETEKHKYIFSRGWYFDEEIYINVDKSIDEIYPIREVQESWSNDGEFVVKVSRVVKTI